MIDKAKEIAAALSKLSIDERIDALNEIRKVIATSSPFRNEPVDCVEWVRSETVSGNDYNPNSVAPPEMELLRLSIASDGYTQPIVAMTDGTVIDGFHRHRVGKEDNEISTRIHGRLPVVSIQSSREGVNDRIAATIRHNRARGEHQIDRMSDIVLSLRRRNWTDKRIMKELGMDESEVVRLAQIGGLEAAFSDVDFSEAWEPA